MSLDYYLPNVYLSRFETTDLCHVARPVGDSLGLWCESSVGKDLGNTKARDMLYHICCTLRTFDKHVWLIRAGDLICSL